MKHPIVAILVLNFRQKFQKQRTQTMGKKV